MPTPTLREGQALTSRLSAILVLLGISVFMNYIDPAISHHMVGSWRVCPRQLAPTASIAATATNDLAEAHVSDNWASVQGKVGRTAVVLHSEVAIAVSHLVYRRWVEHAFRRA